MPQAGSSFWSARARRALCTSVCGAPHNRLTSPASGPLLSATLVGDTKGSGNLTRAGDLGRLTPFRLCHQLKRPSSLINRQVHGAGETTCSLDAVDPLRMAQRVSGDAGDREWRAHRHPCRGARKWRIPQQLEQESRYRSPESVPANRGSKVHHALIMPLTAQVRRPERSPAPNLGSPARPRAPGLSSAFKLERKRVAAVRPSLRVTVHALTRQ